MSTRAETPVDPVVALESASDYDPALSLLIAKALGEVPDDATLDESWADYNYRDPEDGSTLFVAFPTPRKSAFGDEEASGGITDYAGRLDSYISGEVILEISRTLADGTRPESVTATAWAHGRRWVATAHGCGSEVRARRAAALKALVFSVVGTMLVGYSQGEFGRNWSA